MSRRKQKYEYGQEPWYLRDIGGLPGWALVLACGVIAGLAVFIAVLLIGNA